MIRTVACLLFALLFGGAVRAEYVLIPDSGPVAAGGLLEVTLFIPNDSSEEEFVVELPARLTMRTRGVAAAPDIVLRPDESQQMQVRI